MGLYLPEKTPRRYSNKSLKRCCGLHEALYIVCTKSE